MPANLAQRARAAAFDWTATMEDLERLTGFGVAFHNLGQMPRVSTGRGKPFALEPTRPHLCPFCQKMKSTPAGTRACVACDQKRGNARAGRRGLPMAWRCHAGLEEILAPVIVEGNHVATIFGGQARPLRLEAAERARLRARWKRLGHDPRRITALMRGCAPAEPPRMRALARILGTLAEHLATRAAAASIAYAVESEKRTPVEKALALMVQHLEQPLSQEEIARAVHLSPSRFSHVFTQTEGESFRDRLLRIRIERAKELLATTPLAVNEVARRVGYEDPNFFSRIFHEKTGRAPREYRRRFAKA